MPVNKIIDKGDRIAAIAAEVKSSTSTQEVHFRGQILECPIVRLESDLLVYRMKSGRTQVEQYEYVQNNNKSEGFFIDGEENISAQRAQDTILLKLAKDERGPIYQELLQVARQLDPLLLTSGGVVLNGNRRLAAMRDLYASDVGAYENFRHVNAVILPKEAGEQDLDILEAELQMAPEVKLEYSWIDRRLKLRRHRDELNIPLDQIKKTYRFRRRENIHIEIEQLNLAENYLDRYLKKPKAYREVAQKEQMFKELERILRNSHDKSGSETKISESEIQVRQLAGFLLAKEAGNLGSRAYGYMSLVGQDFRKVMDMFAKEKGIDLTVTTTDESSDDTHDDDIINQLGTQVGTQEKNSYVALMPIFENQENTTKTAQNLSNIYDSIKKAEKEKSDKQAALKSVLESSRILRNLDLCTADLTTLNEIKNHLNAIISCSTAHISSIDSIMASDDEVS